MRYVTVASKTRPHTRAPNGDIIHVNGAEVKGEQGGGVRVDDCVIVSKTKTRALPAIKRRVL